MSSEDNGQHALDTDLHPPVLKVLRTTKATWMLSQGGPNDAWEPVKNSKCQLTHFCKKETW